MTKTSTSSSPYSKQFRLRQSKIGLLITGILEVVARLVFLRKETEDIPPPEILETPKKTHYGISPGFSNVSVLLQEHRKNAEYFDSDQEVLNISTNSITIMNHFSTSGKTYSKTSPLGMVFDERLNKWVQKESLKVENQKKSSLMASMMALLMIVFSSFSAFAQTDVSLRTTVDNSMPSIGSTIKYTVWAVNKGSVAATAVKVKDTFPATGVTLNAGSLTTTAGTSATPTATQIDWTIPTIAANDSVKLEVMATVTGRGVYFNTAEVIQASGVDIDSTPGNGLISEDDMSSACFSVPLLWYPGDEYTVSIPNGYRDIVWYKDGIPVTTTSTGATLNADSTLTIKSVGTYTFSTKVNSCPATGCCEIKVIPAEYGSVGNFVWEDTNKDGLQSVGEAPVAGVKVYLLDATGNKLDSTVTDASGKYTFNKLMDGETYKVQFVAPAGRGFTIANTTDPTKNSDAGTGGTTYPVTISVYNASGAPRVATDSLRNNPNLDAGITPPVLGSIGDYVFEDKNKDGIQNAGDAPIAGVKVYLLNGAGVKLDSTVTDLTGKYSFNNLPAGTYQVQFVKPVGFTATLQDVGTTTDALDSDADPISGKTQVVTLVPANGGLAKDNPTLDAGFYKPTQFGSIGDYVWNDTNKDGQQNVGELPATGIKVYLLDASGNKIDSTVTDATGKYLFSNLTSGTYSVQFVAPAGKEFTAPNTGDDNSDSDAGTNGKTGPIVIDTTKPVGDPARDNRSVDAGLTPSIVPLGSIGDYVWEDTNKNGQQDAGELPVAGVKVNLLNASGTVIATTTTDSFGKYLFSDLPSGTYSVEFVAPVGKEFTTSNTGNDNTDSDAGLNGRTGPIVIDATKPAGDPARDNRSVDAGITPIPVNDPRGSIGDYVWNDTNKNGQQDAGETPVSGVTVNLLDATGNVIATTTTDATGKYLFTNLPSGTYAVQFVAPAGKEFTAPNTGDDNTDSDAGVAGKTAPIVIDATKPVGDPARDNRSVDAGLVPKVIPTGSIGDYVWNDTNNNGQQDAGETPAAGIKVYLLDANGNKIDSTVTDGTGKYLFSNVPSGTYAVQFVAPAGTIFTAPNVGNGSTDSDAGVNGKTGPIVIDATKPVGDPARDNRSVDAGLTPKPVDPKGSIGDYVWNDTNKNGQQDAGETPVSGVTVNLLDATGNVIATTSTDANGKYLFSNLSSGTYSVQFIAPAGKEFTTANTGNDNSDSDAGVNGKTGSITIDTSKPAGDPARDNRSVDAGLTPIPVNDPRGSIGDYVWEDTNKNGQQDAGELPVAGVTVNLLDASGAVIATTTTDASGKYLFSNLVSGNYQVQFVSPAGKNFTTANVGGDNTDSDAGADGKTGTISIDTTKPVGDPARDNRSVDAGLMPAAANCATITQIGVLPTPICLGDTSRIFATTSNGTKVRWFMSSVGGDPIATTNSGEKFMIFPTTTTTYYAEVDLSNELGAVCPNPRKPIVVIINAKPQTPTCGGMVSNDCAKGQSTVNLNDYIQSLYSTPGGVWEWHTGWNPNSPIVSNPTAVSVSGKYYLFEKSTAGCYSNAALLMVNIKDCACDLVYGVKAGVDNSICENGTATVVATLTGASTSATWSTSGTGTFSAGLTAVYNPSAADILAGSVTLTATTNDPDAGGVCKPVSDALILTITKKPMTPYSVSCADSVMCKGDMTKLFGFSSVGATINWYTAATGGTLVGTSNSGIGFMITPTATTTYYAEASLNGCVNTVRVPVKVNVKTCNADLAVVKGVSPAGPYSVGQTVTYSVTVTNNGPVAATSVQVADLLPAQLTFVSAAPVGYSNVAGVWSVGNLSVGSSKTLMVQTKINAGGTIVNTAIVSSPENDPTKKANDSSSVAINVTAACDATTPIIACANTSVCAGATVTLTAVNCNGTIVWSNGMTGATINVTPSTSTTYTAKCQVRADCISAASNAIPVTVSTVAAVTITSDVTRICSGKAILTATGCAGGQIVWSDGQIGANIQVSPTATTTYSAVCMLGACKSPASNAIVITTGSDLSAPTVTSTTEKVCPGESVTFTASACTGTVTWSTGATGLTLTVTPSATATYTATCSVGDCKSVASRGITVTVSPKDIPVISSTVETICLGQSVTLNLTGCSGVATWSTGQTGASVVLTPTTNTTVTATCTSGSCVSTASKTINVGTGSAVTVTASATAACIGSTVTLTAAGCAGTVTWSNGTTGATATVTVAATTTYTATCAVTGGCSSTGSVTINAAAKPDAPIVTCGKERLCAGESLMFTAHNCAGTVTWSTGETGVNIVVKPTVTTNYTATCTINGCVSDKSKDAIITIIKPVIGITGGETVCAGQSVTLTADGCDAGIAWSTGGTTKTITVSPTATTNYTITCMMEGCAASGSKTVTVTSPTSPTVTGAGAICAGESITLTASGCTTYTWSNGQTTAAISVKPTATTTYTVSCAGTCSAPASAVVTLSTPTTPTITGGNAVCGAGGSVTLTAAGCAAGYTWSTGATTAELTVSPTATTTYDVQCKGTCGGKASTTVSVGKPTAPVISTTKTEVCPGETLTATAVGCSGTVIWSTGQTGASITVSPTVNTTYSAVCKVGQECTSDKSNEITVRVNSTLAVPVISCSATRICDGESLKLFASNCTGTVTWSTGQTGNEITVSPKVTTNYTATCKVGTCTSEASAVATLNVGPPAAPVVKCELTQVCSGATVTINATACDGVVKWSNGQTGAVLTVTMTQTTAYSAICESTSGKCKSGNSNTLTVSVFGTAATAPKTKDLVNACPLKTVDLSTGVTSTPAAGGSFVFRTGDAITSPAVANIATAGAGKYYVFEQGGSGCASLAGIINVVVSNCDNIPNCTASPATANAGTNTEVCIAKEFFQLNGTIGGSATSARWTSDGTGTFDNAVSLTAKYTYTLADVTKGEINFTLTTNDPDNEGACKAAVSTFKLKLNGIKFVPTITSSKSPTFCSGDSVVLTASDNGAYRYVWSNGATTRSITVKNGGKYTVKLIDDKGCCSIPSNEFTVTTINNIASPNVVSTLKNTCPATTVNLTAALRGAATTTGGMFEYRTGSTPSSPIVGTAGLGNGTYYVFEKTTVGCFSAAARVDVMIDKCEEPQPGDSDVAIAITSDRSQFNINEDVLFTVQVRNNGAGAATNVKVAVVLPEGITFVSGAGFTKSGDTLKTNIASLAVNAFQNVTFTGKITSLGDKTVVAKITGTTQPDRILSNNTSSTVVTCIACVSTFPSIGVALKADTVKKTNGTFDIKYQVIVRNNGNVDLKGVTLVDTLSKVFVAPKATAFTVVQAPKTNTTSVLVANPAFNGTTDPRLVIPSETAILTVGKADTVRYVVNVVLPASTSTQPTVFTSNVIGTGVTTGAITSTISDTSNDGVNPARAGATPTEVRLGGQAGAPPVTPGISIAYITRMATDTVKKANGSYDVKYCVVVKNTGNTTLTNVTIADTLINTFKSPATFTIVSKPTITSKNSALTVDTDYNGNNKALLVTGGGLGLNKSDTICYTINLVKGAAAGPFVSKTVATAIGNGTNVNGTNSSTLNFGRVEPPQDKPCIDLSFVPRAVVDTLKQTNGSYNIRYRIAVKNCGTVALTNVTVCDTISKAYKTPVTFTMVGMPTFKAGSTFKLDSTFNGNTKPCILAAGSTLAAGKSDTISYIINVIKGTANGPFNNVVYGTATGNGQTAKATTNQVLTFNLPALLVGVAKSVESVTFVPNSNKVFRVVYAIKVQNYGSKNIDSLSLQDDLGATFGNKVLIDSVKVIEVPTGFALDSTYTGRGLKTNLLVKAKSKLAVGESKVIKLRVRVNVKDTTATEFNNSAIAKGKTGTELTDDQSTDGTNPDPDNDGNPKNNSVPTKGKFVVENPTTTPKSPIGIAKKADTTKLANGSYDVKYTFVLKNYGTKTITKIQVLDSLSKVFIDSVATITLKAAPTVGAGSKLKVSKAFTKAVPTILVADSSSLAAGKSDTIKFTLNVSNNTSKAVTFCNQAFVSAYDSVSVATVKDASVAGLNPDVNGNNNPSDDNGCTNVTLPGNASAGSLFIPQGLSPNGDKENDVWLIKGTNGKKCDVKIYNRWGGLVYFNENYNGEFKGESNTGIRFGTEGLPDGTYFYCVACDGKQYVGPLTIAK
jgi:large repetitive protein